MLIAIRAGQLVHVAPDIERRPINKLEQLDPAIWIASGEHGVSLHDAVGSLGLREIIVWIVVVDLVCHL